MTNVDDLRKGDHVIVTLDAYFVRSDEFPSRSKYVSLALSPESPDIEFCLRESAAVTFERVAPPLPTAVGSVIKDKNEILYMLHDDDRWHSCFGSYLMSWQLKVVLDWTLVFDAGA